MISANAVMNGSYDHGEVARSLVIAIAASYAALDLVGRVTAARGRVRLSWLGGGAIAMGTGIWAMHFKGMLAFHLPVPVEYHWPTVLASLLVAILASAVALYVASRQKMRPADALSGSIIMGAGIAGMHYTGMAAMRLPAVTRFSPLLVMCSILLAILFSLFALLMAFGLREETRWSVPRRLGSAAVMGAAVSAMHYTGMAAASFIPASPPDLSNAVSVPPFANFGVVMAALIVLVTALTTSSVDRRSRAEIQRINQDLERRVTERTLQLEVFNQTLRKEIVERERAEEALRRSEGYLRLVIDTIPQQIWSGPPDGSLDYCNARWRSYTGLTEEELRGAGWQRMLHPDDRERVIQAWSEAVANGTRYEQEERHRGTDGLYRWFLARGVPLRDSEGRIVSWYGTNTDIEDRKQAEWALHEAQAGLSRAARLTAMGDLVGAIAHEVNQPIAAIVTNGNFCLRQLAGATANSDKLRDAISEIVNDGTRASAVISRIRALLQKHTSRSVAVDINQVIQEVVVLLRHELGGSRVALRADLDGDLPRVSGDHVLLQQVVINLVMNGIDAMRSIEHGPRQLLIKSARDHDQVSVQVKDSGTGFDPQQAEHIFEPFFTTKPEGIGMGLSISRSIVESHGGRLWGESNSMGALFQFTLPAICNSDDGVL
jgi:PAS domain S-box-containing protein